MSRLSGDPVPTLDDGRRRVTSQASSTAFDSPAGPTNLFVNPPAGRLSAKISILELNGTEMIISWHDSTSCNYDYQRWFKAKASKRGTCALTGCEIARGTYLFRPYQVPRPVNFGAMILASVIEAQKIQA